MIVYYIRDADTGDVWSRNRWGKPTSIPDLYSSVKRAEWQLGPHGKVAQIAWGPGYCHHTNPQIIEARLEI